MNQGFSLAANDLGLGGMGDGLPKQLQEQEAERKKKMNQPAGMDGMQYTMTGGGLAAMDLGLR